MQTGMKCNSETSGKKSADYADAPGSAQIPSESKRTPDGETPCYRVTKNLQLLENSSKIPSLRDLKDAQRNTTPTITPAK